MVSITRGIYLYAVVIVLTVLLFSPLILVMYLVELAKIVLRIDPTERRKRDSKS